MDPPRVCLGSTTSITLTGRGFTNQLNQNRSACRFQISEDEFLCKLVIYPPHTHTPTHPHTHTPTTHTPTPTPTHPHPHTHTHTHTPTHSHTYTPTHPHLQNTRLCCFFVLHLLFFFNLLKKKTSYRELEYWMIKNLIRFVPFCSCSPCSDLSNRTNTVQHYCLPSSSTQPYRVYNYIHAKL